MRNRRPPPPNGEDDRGGDRDGDERDPPEDVDRGRDPGVGGEEEEAGLQRVRGEHQVQRGEHGDEDEDGTGDQPVGPRPEPTASRVSTRGTKKSSHRSDSHSARVRATGWSSRPSTGARKTAKPPRPPTPPPRRRG